MLNLKKLLTKILVKIDSPMLQQHDVSPGSIAASTSKNFTAALTAPSGYTKALGIAGWSLGGTNASTCNLYRLYVSGTTLYYGMRNTLTGSTASPTVSVWGLWTK